MKDESVGEIRLYKRKKTARQIVKLDYEVWTFISKHLSDNYDKHTVTIEQKNGQVDVCEKMDEAYELISGYVSDITRIVIVASAKFNNMNIEIINTQKIFKPSFIIETECKTGRALSVVMDFTDKLMAKFGVPDKGMNVNKVIYYIAIYILSKVFIRIAAPYVSSYIISVSLFCILVLFLYFLRYCFRRLLNGRNSISFGMEKDASDKYDRLIKIIGTIEKVFAIPFLVLSTIAFFFLN